MGSNRRDDRTYAALASGPGSFKKAMEAAMKRPPPSEPVAPDERAAVRPANPTEPNDAPVGGAGPWHGSELEQGPIPPTDASPAYCRVLEELTIFVVPAVAHRILSQCLEDEGSSPQEAIAYDLRSILVESLPRRLRTVLSHDRATAAVDAVEHALMQMRPPRAQPTRRSSSGSLPAAGSVPPSG